MPAIAQMAGEVRTRDRKGLWQQLVAPDWLQLAFGRDTTGLLQVVYSHHCWGKHTHLAAAAWSRATKGI
jgi:hypothetical protein